MLLVESPKENKETAGLGNKRMIVDHPNHCIFEMGQNTEKSPVDLRRLAVTQNPLKDHPLNNNDGRTSRKLKKSN